MPNFRPAYPNGVEEAPRRVQPDAEEGTQRAQAGSGRMALLGANAVHRGDGEGPSSAAVWARVSGNGENTLAFTHVDKFKIDCPCLCLSLNKILRYR